MAGEPGRVDFTDRLMVEGGWLYRTRVHEGVALTFVPSLLGLRRPLDAIRPVG